MLGGIVTESPAREARDAGLLKAPRMFVRLDRDGVVCADGTRSEAVAVIWCTGFRPAHSHLAPLGPRGHIATSGTQVVGEPRLPPLGHGDCTGPASVTLIGRPARDAAREIIQLLNAGG